MKKYFFTAAALLIAASCTRELPETAAIQNENFVPFTIENANGPVIAPEDGSRTQLGNLTGSVVNWTAGDNAILFDNSGSCAGHLFTGSVQSDNTKINLSGEMHEGSTAYWLLYPYNSNASLSSGVITTTLSASQNAVAGSFADKTAISLAKGTRTPGETGASGLTFDNLCAVLAITIPTYVDNAQSVTIASNNGTAMAGSISFNASTGAMTAVSGASSITLNGPLNAGQTYFAVVAPANYTGGFTLTLTTAGNNTYSAATTRDLNAQAGTVYPLGTLGLKLSNPAMSVYIHHTTDASGNLNGTDADLSVKVNNQNIPAELVAMATWDIVLKNSDNVIVRRYDGPNGTMAKANGYDYLPQGTYTVSGTYTTLDGKVRTLTSNTATSLAPTFDVNVTGYTSYNYGVGADGYSKNVNTANGLDGSTIYGLGASVTISADLMNDSKYSKSFTYSYDQGAGVSISGNATSIPNKTAQSWNTHTLSASCTFDGKKVDSETRNLHVTGLPYRVSPPTNSGSHPWSVGDGNVTWGSDRVEMKSKSQADYPRIDSPAFYLPSDVNVAASMKIVRNKTTLNYNSKLRITLNSDSNILYDSNLNNNSTYESTINTTMSSSKNKWRIQYRYAAAGPIVYTYYFNVLYR